MAAAGRPRGSAAPATVAPAAAGGHACRWHPGASILAGARAVALFGEWSPAGSRAAFTARGRHRRGGGSGRADVRGRGQPALGPGARGPPGQPGTPCRAAPAAAAGRPGARPAGGQGHGAVLRGRGRPVHPGDRRRGPAVLGLPRVQRPAAGRGHRTRPGRHHDPQPDGERLPAARAVRQVLRPGHAPAGRGGAGHRRAARHVRAGVQRQVLRGHGLPGPRELHRQLQRAAHPLRHRGAARLAGAQLLLQHLLQRGEPAALRRAVVTSRRLRPAAGHDRPGLRLFGLPR